MERASVERTISLWWHHNGTGRRGLTVVLHDQHTVSTSVLGFTRTLSNWK